MNDEKKHFGEHLTIDGYGGSHGKLDDRELVLRCLCELPEKLGMHPLDKPVVYSAPDNGIKDPGGWSGFVVIAESHISVHTFPKRRFVSVDVYTCRNGIDREFIEDYFKEKFSLEELEVNFIQRGKKYPKEDFAL
jgi:S-adenosylmethionine decarboxylase